MSVNQVLLVTGGSDADELSSTEVSLHKCDLEELVTFYNPNVNKYVDKEVQALFPHTLKI